MSPRHVDVVIVGGGPAGVATSLFLAKRGMSVRVLEREPEVYDLPRAIVMDDTIQRLFQAIGLSDELDAITTPMVGAEFVKPGGERIIGIDFPPGTRTAQGHHPSVAYYQPELEEFLRRHAIEAGVDLRLGMDVTSVEQTDADAVVTASGSGESSHRASWVLAADGASSPIRKSLGIPFVSLGFDQDWLVVDFELTRPVPTLPTVVQQICDPDRPVTFVTGHRDYRRWEFQLQEGEDRLTMADPEQVWELVSQWLTPEDARLVRAVVYRFHATVADTMRSGRVLLVGDAAHQMPPFLGQGLAAGIRDGFDLAWKISLIKAGHASAGLLDSYSAERRPHAEATVANAVDTGRLIDELSGRGVAEDLGAAYGGSRGTPMLDYGIRVGDDPSIGRPLPQPMLDDQAFGSVRLDEELGPFFTLLTGPEFSTGSSEILPADGRWAGMTRVLQLPTQALGELLGDNEALLVRPDRVVAAKVSSLSELVDAVSQLDHHFSLDAMS